MTWLRAASACLRIVAPMALVAALYTGPGLRPGWLLLPLEIMSTLGAWKGNLSERLPAANGSLSDVVFQFIPWDLEASRQLVAGRIPWLDRYSGSETPLLTNPQAALLSPFTWPRLVLGFSGWGVTVFLRLFIAGVGMYALARQMGAEHRPAVLSALAYETSGYLVVWAFHPHSNVAAALPLLGLALLRLMEKVSSGRVVALAGAAALASSGGHPESLATGVLSLFVLGAWHGVQSGRPRRFAWALGSALAGFLALGVIYVPFLAVVRHSAVAAHRETAPHFGLRTSALVAQILPGAQGGPLGDELDLTRFWHPEEEFPGRTSTFVGFLVLVALAASWPRLAPAMRRGLGVGAVALVLSWCLPGLELLVGWLPLLRWTLPPYRAVGFVLFGAAAAGPAVWELAAKSHRTLGAALMVSGLLLVAVGLGPSFRAARPVIVSASRLAISRFTGSKELPNPAEVYEARMSIYLDAIAATARRRFALPGVAWLLAGLGLATGGRARRALVVAGTGLELLAFGVGYLPSVRADELPRAPPVVAAIRSADPAGEYRLVAGPGVFPPNLGTAFELRDLRSYTVLESQSEVEKMRRAGYEATAPLSFAAALDVSQRRQLSDCGVRFFLAAQSVAGGRRIAGSEPPAVGLYELPGARPLPPQESRPPRGAIAGAIVSLLGVLLAGALGLCAPKSRSGPEVPSDHDTWGS